MMSPWVSLFLEAGMAVLMAALIVYCVKLNRRLALLRNQDSEIKELITGLRDASERAELSVQRLKAAGLAAERSLRSAIEDAAVMRTELAGIGQASAGRPASDKGGEKSPAAPARTDAPPSAGRPAREKRDMLMGAGPQAGGDSVPAPAAPVRPRTREEAEESVIQAIRSARGEA